MDIVFLFYVEIDVMIVVFVFLGFFVVGVCWVLGLVRNDGKIFYYWVVVVDFVGKCIGWIGYEKGGGDG